MIDQNTQRELKTALEKERALLTKELETIATRDPNLKDDWNVKHFEWSENQIDSREELESGEAVNEIDEDMKNKALSDHLELRLKEVNEAIDRIKKGTYGACEICQKEIPLERLKANSAAKTDIEHSKNVG